MVNEASIIISAKDQFSQTFTSLNKQLSLAQSGFAALGVSASVVGLASFVKSSMDAADELHDLAIKGQMSVEALSGLKEIGRTSSTNAETIATAAAKMAKALSSGGEAAKNAVAALGLSYAKLKSEKPEQAMLDIAKAMDRFADGQGKAAIAMTLFGKSGDNLLPFMKDLAEAGQVHATMTQEQADRADELADKMDKLGGNFDRWQQGIGLAVLPTMGALIGAFTDIDEKANNLNENESAKVWAEATGRVLATTYDILRSFGAAFVLTGKSAAMGFKDIETAALSAEAWLNPFKRSSEEIPKLWKERNEFAAQWQADVQDFLQNSNAGFGTLEKFNKNLEQAYATTTKLKTSPGGNKPQVNFNGSDPSGKISDYQRLTNEVLKFTAAQEAETAQGDELTAGQKMMVSIREQMSNGTKKLTDEEKSHIEALLKTALASEKVNLDEAEHAKRAHEVSQQNIKNYQEQQAALSAYENDWNTYLSGLENSLKTLTEQNDLYGLTAQQIAAVNLQRAEENVEIAKRNGVSQDYLARLEREVDLRKQILGKTAALEAKQEWSSFWSSIDQAGHDAWMHIGEKGQSVLDRLQQSMSSIIRELAYMAAKKWVISIFANATGIAGSLGGAAGVANTAAAGGSFLSGASSISSMWNAFSGSTASAMSSFATSSMGASLGLSTLTEASMQTAASMGMAVDTMTSLTSLGSGLVAAAPYLVAGLAAFSLIGGSIFGGGHVMRPKAYGDFNVGDTGVDTLKLWTNKEGYANDAALKPAEAMAKYLQDAIHGIGGKIADDFVMGVALQAKYKSLSISIGEGIAPSGKNRDAGGDYTKDMPAIQAGALIATIAKGYTDLPGWLEKFAASLDTTKKVAVSSLEALSTINNLHKSLDGLSGVFDRVRTSVEGVADASGIAAVQALAANTQTFYSLFYTQEEQKAQRLSQLGSHISDVFNQIGTAVPESMAEFRALAETLAKSSNSAKEFGLLMGISNDFAEKSALSDGFTSAAEAISSAESNLRSAWEAESNRLKELVTRFDSIAKNMSVYKNGLLTGDLSPLSPLDKYNEAKRQFDDVSKRAQLGDLNAVDLLQGTSDAFLKASQGYYASSPQYASDFQKVMDAVTGTESMAVRQYDIANQQLSGINSTVGALITINSSVQGVEAAIAALTSVRAASTSSASVSSGSAAGAAINAANDQYTIHDGYLWAANGARITSISDKNQTGKLAAFHLAANSTGGYSKLPGYAVGGLASGWSMVGERGPELVNFTQPGRVYTADQTRQAIGGADQETKQLLRDVLAELRAANLQRGAAAMATIGKLDSVADRLDANQRTLARAA